MDYGVCGCVVDSDGSHRLLECMWRFPYYLYYYMYSADPGPNDDWWFMYVESAGYYYRWCLIHRNITGEPETPDGQAEMMLCLYRAILLYDIYTTISTAWLLPQAIIPVMFDSSEYYGWTGLPEISSWNDVVPLPGYYYMIVGSPSHIHGCFVCFIFCVKLVCVCWLSYIVVWLYRIFIKAALS